MSPTSRRRKLEQLTAEQIRRMEAYRAEWLATCLTPGPADLETVRRVTGAMYGALKEPVPAAPVLRLSSPAMVALFLALARLGPRERLGGQLRGQLRDQLGDQLRDQLGGQLRDQLGGQLGGQLRDQLWGQLRDQLWGQLRDQLWGHFYGCCEGAWTAFYAFPLEIGCTYDPTSTERLGWWRDLAASSFWWWPYRGMVIASDRPISRWDDRRRLHAPDRAAIEFSDGYALYAWHGVRVPERVILRPDTLYAHQEILNEANAEVRRVMIERVGHERFLLQSGARPVHQDEAGALYRIEMPGDEPIALVHVTNATPEPDGSRKKYVLRVPPNLERARQAVAWTFGKTEREYAPTRET